MTMWLDFGNPTLSQKARNGGAAAVSDSRASGRVHRLFAGGIRVDDCQIPFAAELPIEAEIRSAANRAGSLLADEQLLCLLGIAEIALRNEWLDDEARSELELRNEDFNELREALEFALDENVGDRRFNA